MFLTALAIASISACPLPDPNMPTYWGSLSWEIEWVTVPDPTCLASALFDYASTIDEEVVVWTNDYADLCAFFGESNPDLAAALAAEDEYIAGRVANALHNFEVTAEGCPAE